MKSKVYALFWIEGEGENTIGCRTKYQSLIAFQELFSEHGIEKVIALEDIKETRQYKHKHCDMYTVGDLILALNAAIAASRIRVRVVRHSQYTYELHHYRS